MKKKKICVWSVINTQSWAKSLKRLSPQQHHQYLYHHAFISQDGKRIACIIRIIQKKAQANFLLHNIYLKLPENTKCGIGPRAQRNGGTPEPPYTYIKWRFIFIFFYSSCTSTWNITSPSTTGIISTTFTVTLYIKVCYDDYIYISQLLQVSTKAILFLKKTPSFALYRACNSDLIFCHNLLSSS